MKTKQRIMFPILLVMLILSCKSETPEFNKLYNIKFDPASSKINWENVDVRIDDPDFTLIITESAPEQKTYMGVSGTDGTNFFHELKAYEIEAIAWSLLRNSSDKNIQVKNAPALPLLDFYFESKFKKNQAPPVDTIILELVNLLESLFPVKVTREKVMTPVYHFTLSEDSNLESHYIKLDKQRYFTSAGLADTGDKYSNYDEEKNEVYVQFEDILMNLSCSFNFQYQNHIQSEGALVIPYETVDHDFDKKLKFLLDHCRIWGIDVEIKEKLMENIFIEFGEL